MRGGISTQGDSSSAPLWTHRQGWALWGWDVDSSKTGLARRERERGVGGLSVEIPRPNIVQTGARREPVELRNAARSPASAGVRASLRSSSRSRLAQRGKAKSKFRACPQPVGLAHSARRDRFELLDEAGLAAATTTTTTTTTTRRRYRIGAPEKSSWIWVYFQ